MKKFAVFSGFLGSGKTTTMISLTRYFTIYHGKAAMISNDLGGAGLADNRLAKLNDCEASELTGTCICYQTENLVNRLNSLFDEKGCQLVISDIPGFGVGALDHVYHTLNRDYQEIPLAPFTVLVEPATVEKLMGNPGGDLGYILRSQLKEADVIVLTKSDLLAGEEKQRDLAFLMGEFPEARVLAVSALTGDGLEKLSQVLIHENASLRKPDLGYGGTEFCSAMGKFSEYNMQYYAIVCCDFFDGNAYLRNIAQAIQEKIRKLPGEIPHLKLLAWDPDGDFGKADVLGVDRPLELSHEFCHPCKELAVVINSSAICPSKDLGQIITQTVEAVSQHYKLSVMIYKKECLDVMGDD